MKVLLIDDEEDMRRLGKASLTKLGGMTVREARSGDEGIAVAEAERPDVILLDVLMPGLDGPATLDELRRRPATAAIPVVFLTGKSDPAELERLRALGATGVIAKPFDPLTLPRRVRDAVGAA